MPQNVNSTEIAFNAESIANAYANLNDQEAQLNDQLEALFSKQCHIEAKFRGITKVIPKLQIVRGDGQKLVDMITYTSALAENVSSKVRQLDIARSRVSECQQRVHDLLDLQLCSQGVQTALHNEDYEKASAHVHRFLSMDQSLLKQTADDVAEDCTNVTNSFLLLQEAANQLKKIVTYKFDEAVKEEDLASVERFFKIFPLIGLKDEGLRKFSIYLTSKLQETSKNNLKLATETQQSDKRATVIYSDTLTMLFESIARVLEIHQPLVETYYGPGRLLDVIKILQQECDRQCKRIITEFRKQRQLEKIFLQIKEFSRSLNNTNRVETKLDPKSIDLLLNELTVMLQRAHLYQRFVKRRVLTDLEAGSLENHSSELENVLRGLILCMQELLATYLQLEAFYMEASVLKAVAMDTLEENAQTTSMVDDVFFIVNKAIRRAGTTSSLDGACAVLNNACTLLETEFCEVLRQQLRLGFPSGYLDLSQAYNVLHSSLQQGRLQGDSDTARATFLAYVNNAESSLEYTETLKKSLSEELSNALGLIMQCNDKEKLDSCLSGLSTVSSALKFVIDYGMQQLQASAVKPRVHPWLDSYLTSNHQLSEEEFVNYESDKTFIQTLIMNLDGLLKSFKDNLTTGNYDHLVSLVTSEVTSHFEKVIFKSTFNRFGGLVLDKEVRALASYLTSVTSWSVRDKFARLTQIATVLNLEKVQEIVDYWGSNSGSLSWRLSPSEIKQVMALRRKIISACHSKEDDIMGQSPSTSAMARSGKRRSFRANWKHRRSQSSQGSLSATCNFLETDLKIDHLNINVASEEELMTLPGISRTIAQSIVEYRRVIGRFNKVEDLALVPGIGANKLDMIRPEICVTRKKTLSRTSSHAQSIDSLPSQDSLNISRSICKGPSISKALNLNTASVFDLMTINTLNQELAANIVEYRQRRGLYRSVDDLVKVKGINLFRLSAIRPHLFVEDYSEDSKSLPLNGNLIPTPLQNIPLKNGRMPGHRKSLSAPIKYIPLNNGLSPVKDIFELLSAYTPRPIVEEDFNYEHLGRPAIRIATWFLQDFNCDKASNPGVLEVIARTILENKFSLIAVQGIEDPISLSKICQELNNPLIRRVSDWRDNSHKWLNLADENNTLGFIYDSKRIQKLRQENFSYESMDALLTSFQINCSEFEIININLKNDNMDISSLTNLFKTDAKSNIIFAGDITHLVKGKVENLHEESLVLPKMTSTNTGSGQPKIRLYDNLIMANNIENRYTGVHGIVRQGLTHLAIPRGWSWGGFVSDHCPVWCELFID